MSDARETSATPSGPVVGEAPVGFVAGRHGLVAAPDRLAAEAGLAMLRSGGSAADAAVATSAVLAVTFQHACGLGGDLWAVAHPGGRGDRRELGGVLALDGAGRAGGGADPERLRRAGHTEMPRIGDPAVVPVPGCVDAWLTLHERLGRLSLGEVLAPAIDYAANGFPASPGLAAAIPFVAGLAAAADYREPERVVGGTVLRRPGVARTLQAIIDGGRDAFYHGEFGEELLEVGGGEYHREDLDAPQARWVAPLTLSAFGRRLWSAPPSSQGYLTLAAAWIADGLPLPEDPEEPGWAHLLVEALRQASFDRNEVLFDGADGVSLLAPERLAPRRAAIDPLVAAGLPVPGAPGGTVACVAAGPDGDAVSLLQSNAAGWGSHLVTPRTRIFLHNRGLGFSLRPGHPAEYGPGRRPPHTLSPLLVTDEPGAFVAALATMGGDSQPQVLLQLLVRLLRHGEEPGAALAAGRFALAAASREPARRTGFDTWSEAGATRVLLEGQVSARWPAALAARGHPVELLARFAPGFGHAQAVVAAGGAVVGASDPRSTAGGAAAW